MLLEIDVQSRAADLVGVSDDFMSCLQPLCILCCFGECARVPSDTLPPPSATNFTYQTHDSGSSLKHPLPALTHDPSRGLRVPIALTKRDSQLLHGRSVGDPSF
jgi:hypothetical protein